MNSYFSLILTTINLNIRLRNQHPIQGRGASRSQVLIQNFRVVPVRWLKINLGCFCFQNRWNIINQLLIKKIIQDVYLPSGFCDLPWDSGIWFKKVSLTLKPWDLAGLLKYEISFTEKNNLRKTNSSCMYRFS